MNRSGKIELICGSMFSGKTEELIRRIRRAEIAKQKVQVFKPVIDSRFHANKVKSHGGRGVEAVPVDSAETIPHHIDADTSVVAIDEIQFFEPTIIDVIEALADDGKRVICAGLDQDFRGEPFGMTMPMVMARAEDVDKLHAICVVCGDEASRTQRLIDGRPAQFSDPVIMVGASERYEARCRGCHEIGGKNA